MGHRLPFDGHDNKPETQVIFSLEDGFVWASFPGTEGAIKLGNSNAVTAMMEDFLAQYAIGKRLNGDEAIWPL